MRIYKRDNSWKVPWNFSVFKKNLVEGNIGAKIRSRYGVMLVYNMKRDFQLEKKTIQIPEAKTIRKKETMQILFEELQKRPKVCTAGIKGKFTEHEVGNQDDVC